MLHASPACWPRSLALSSMGCSSVLQVRPCWRVPREFALLNGRSAAIEENPMKYLSTVTRAAVFAAVLAFATLPAEAQAQAQPKQAELKPASPTAIAAAKEILTMKNVSAQYANAVPSVIQRTKDAI